MSGRHYQPCKTACSGELLLCQRETSNSSGLLVVGNCCYVRERLSTLQECLQRLLCQEESLRCDSMKICAYLLHILLMTFYLLLEVSILVLRPATHFKTDDNSLPPPKKKGRASAKTHFDSFLAKWWFLSQLHNSKKNCMPRIFR